MKSKFNYTQNCMPFGLDSKFGYVYGAYFVKHTFIIIPHNFVFEEIALKILYTETGLRVWSTISLYIGTRRRTDTLNCLYVIYV